MSSSRAKGLKPAVSSFKLSFVFLMPGSDVTYLSAISLIIIKGPHLPSSGVGLGGGGRAHCYATDGKKKNITMRPYVLIGKTQI